MIELTSFGSLQRLESLPLPILTSPDVAIIAVGLATRFVRAHTFLSELLAVTPEVGLLILSPTDWASYAHAAFPQYGLTHYDHDRRLVITGVQTSNFWQPALAIIQLAAQEQLHELAQVYGQPNGEINLTPHIDLYVVHDLGHAFHLHANSWFPRRWLMEYFADLCAYTYLALHEPDQLPALESLPRAMRAIQAAYWPLHTLRDFDAYYGKSELSIENYLWFHGHLFAVAQQEYQRAGAQALQQMWQIFVLGNLQKVADTELATLLERGQPHLAQLMKHWGE
jgi:hypothetical protein